MDRSRRAGYRRRFLRNILVAVPVATAIVCAGSAGTLAAETSTSAAATAPRVTPPAQGTPPALSFPLQHGFHVVRSFKAASGLTGWVMRDPKGQYGIFYSTADGQTLLTGHLVASSGADLSQQYSAQYVPQPDLTALWGRLQKASIVVTGATGAPKAVIYAIMDPNCIFCHMLWIALKPYEAVGLQVRWIPVGFLHQDSAAKAAALLKGGAAAMQTSQQNFDVKTESGGIAGIPITAAMKVRLDANLQLMQDANVEGTPGLFYKDAAGHVQHADGMPSLSQLASITGLPPQAETDPQLLRLEK